MLVRTLTESYLLGARGMLFRLKVAFRPAERPVEHCDRTEPAIAPRRVRSAFAGGVAASLGLLTAASVVNAGEQRVVHDDQVTESREQPRRESGKHEK